MNLALAARAGNSLTPSAEARARSRAPLRSAAAGSRLRHRRSAPRAPSRPLRARARSSATRPAGLRAHASLPLPSRASMPSLRAPTSRLPPRSQAQPPNIAFSVSARSRGRSSRIRSSRPGSRAIDQPVRAGRSASARRVFCMAQPTIFGSERQKERAPIEHAVTA